jgi:drug/metabolite transporter (DMT)-like permease
VSSSPREADAGQLTPHPHESGALPYLALALGIFSLGFSGILVRWAQAPGIITSFYRMLLAGVLLGIPFLRRAQAAGGLSRRGIWVAALGGAFFAADVATWSTGVMLGGATNPTLLANVAPVWVALAAVLLLKERLAGRFWLGLALAFAGAGLVLRVDLTRGAAFGQGSALGLLASVFYGGYLFVTQLGRRDLDSLSYTWIAGASSTLVLLLGGLAFRLPFTGYPPASYWNFLGLAVGSQVLGYLAVTYALGRLPASLVAPTLLGQPVVTAALAVPLLGESISWLQAGGGMAVLAGVALVHRASRRDNNQG